MKVGILTYHSVRNYGAFLQAYSLCNRLNQESDISAEIIDFRMACEINEYKDSIISKRTFTHPIRWTMAKRIHRIQDILFAKAKDKLTLSKTSLVSDSIEKFVSFVNNKYDVIIAGSDEIWKTNGFRGFPNPYWLIGNLTARKFSYAASGRNDYSLLSEKKQQILAEAIHDFEWIGVRDILTLKEVSKYTAVNQQVHICCDPSFLYDDTPNSKNGENILRKKCSKSTARYIGLMTSDSRIAVALKKIIDDDVEIVSLCNWHPYTTNLCELDPFQWLDVISSLDLMISSFYHGICFSVRIGTPVVAYGTSEKKSKLKELMTYIGRENDYTENLLEILESNNGKRFINEQLTRKKMIFSPSDSMLVGYKNMIHQMFDGVQNE